MLWLWQVVNDGHCGCCFCGGEDGFAVQSRFPARLSDWMTGVDGERANQISGVDHNNIDQFNEITVAALRLLSDFFTELQFSSGFLLRKPILFRNFVGARSRILPPANF